MALATRMRAALDKASVAMMSFKGGRSPSLPRATSLALVSRQAHGHAHACAHLRKQRLPRTHVHTTQHELTCERTCVHGHGRRSKQNLRTLIMHMHVHALLQCTGPLCTSPCISNLALANVFDSLSVQLKYAHPHMHAQLGRTDTGRFNCNAEPGGSFSGFPPAGEVSLQRGSFAAAKGGEGESQRGRGPGLTASLFSGGSGSGRGPLEVGPRQGWSWGPPGCGFGEQSRCGAGDGMLGSKRWPRVNHPATYTAA